MTDVAFVLLTDPVAPQSAQVLNAAQAYGLGLTPRDSDPQTLTFDLTTGGNLVVALMPAPHPDAPQMPVGVTSPVYAEIATSPAHLIVAATGLTGAPRERDTTMAILTSAVLDTVTAVGAKLGHGVVFHRARLFAESARLAAQQQVPLPVEVAVDITAAQESPTRMSFLTHGLVRYGREEFLISCPIEGKGALGFVLNMARWVLAEPGRQLPTGDTVGRTPDERLTITRVPSPTGTGAAVIRLDLP